MMDELSALIPIILLAVLIGIIAVIVWTMRRGDMAFDVRQTYFYLVALSLLLLAFFSTFTLADRVFTMIFADPSGSFDLDMRQPIAEALGIILVALPVWWLHWRDARRRALTTKHLLALRIYLYTVTVIALVTAVIVGGMAASGIMKALFGLVDFSSADSLRVFWRDELTAVVNLLTALLVWSYHWRAVEHVPVDN